MNRSIPRLALACALTALTSASASAGYKPQPSNRTPGLAEPASNWIRLRAVPPMKGSIGADKDFFTLTYWCHKTDCSLDSRAQGTGKNRISYGMGDAYRAGIPVYTLVAKTDPLVKLPYYRAIPAPWGVEYSRDLVRFFGFDGGIWDSQWVADLKEYPEEPLAEGQVIVDADEPRESGKPLPLGFTDSGAACTPASYEQYFGAAAGADGGRTDRLFLPIEFELEKAELSGGGHTARIHSGKLDGQPFSTVVENTKDGNNLLVPERFVQAMRPEIRQAAQAYYAQAGGPSSEFTAFEKRFLHCRMGFAGAADPWMAAAAKASANPAPFVASWRAFVREELHHYLAEQTVPPGPRDAGWATYDAKPAWDEMLARTKEWLEQGKIAATPAAVPRPQPQTSSPPKVAPQQGEQIGSKMKSILDQLGGR